MSNQPHKFSFVTVRRVGNTRVILAVGKADPNDSQRDCGGYHSLLGERVSHLSQSCSQANMAVAVKLPLAHVHIFSQQSSWPWATGPTSPPGDDGGVVTGTFSALAHASFCDCVRLAAYTIEPMAIQM